MAENSRQQGWWLWSKNPVSLMLWPLSLIFSLLVKVRVLLYQWHFLKSTKLPIPVLIIGNISLGGNGKTPVVVSLLKLLQDKGYQPGILTRGYKSDYEQETTILSQAHTFDKAGDEANMLSELCKCPIAVGANRVESATTLLKQFPELDLLITDDGLQHYALDRDIEIIVQRQQAYGNGFCLPAGPLREPKTRLKNADIIIDRDGPDISERLGSCWNLKKPDLHCEISDFTGQKVNALAGIGFPELFFDALRKQGLTLNDCQSFSDHENFTAQHLQPFINSPLLVTHKDAVKLRPFATENIWVVPLELTLSDDLQYRLLTLLEHRLHG
ncbi:MAG: tetraacyldisaccharide 4'-kinase [Gammaproteobacteria bacterium]|jgi:tetraacyldisaccharide 4'-kinase|nr:tetraacyldisaccharide 4'-kinase [Gammaproteobacteria bacterium]MBT3721887.1 tetraacyldisaccharide 4'-kinase [Gammaproteobacteria bacterium]MBT4077465.1 tetraacyldisaccharide 4'-kinase [Gammaproteobacteria bacterium]MBT4196908.1 tetraacyldisaccharide 4'-kinase [Gammaproteobacteria bacterium]MBT4451376.1 tetraacyldisaccharide 4'-kinase [Gammaproteobacteria bacterium]